MHPKRKYNFYPMHASKRDVEREKEEPLSLQLSALLFFSPQSCFFKHFCPISSLQNLLYASAHLEMHQWIYLCIYLKLFFFYLFLFLLFFCVRWKYDLFCCVQSVAWMNIQWICIGNEIGFSCCWSVRFLFLLLLFPFRFCCIQLMWFFSCVYYCRCFFSCSCVPLALHTTSDRQHKTYTL